MREKIKNIEELGKMHLIYGIVDEELMNGDTYVWEYAIYNEYGTKTKNKNIRIPERPFFRTFQWNKKDLLKRYIKQWITHTVNGNAKPLTAYKRIGRYIKMSLEESLLQGSWTPNHPTTIKLKGGDQPLYDTGNLLEAIGFIIYENDKEIYREVGRKKW